MASKRESQPEQKEGERWYEELLTSSDDSDSISLLGHVTRKKLLRLRTHKGVQTGIGESGGDRNFEIYKDVPY